MELDGVTHTEHGCSNGPSSMAGVRSPATPADYLSDREKFNWGAYARKPPSPRALPIVRTLFDLADSQYLTRDALSHVSGYSVRSLVAWRGGDRDPSVKALIDCFNALGYDLVPVKRDKQ